MEASLQDHIVAELKMDVLPACYAIPHWPADDRKGACQHKPYSSISVTPPEMANFIASAGVMLVRIRTRSFFTK